MSELDTELLSSSILRAYCLLALLDLVVYTEPDFLAQGICWYFDLCTVRLLPASAPLLNRLTTAD
jgi:hypothetical protein